MTVDNLDEEELSKPANRSLAKIKQQGRRARERARDRALARSGQSRIADMDWYPEIESFTDDNWKNHEIAEALNLSERRIQQIRAAGRMNWSGQFAPAKSKKALADEFQPMVEFTADAFKLFFEHFSGLELSRFGYEMVHEFINNRNLMVNVPPRHAKSTIVSTWLPIWLLCIDRNEQIIIVSVAQDVAKTFARAIAFELEFNHALVKTFGRFAPERAGDTPWRPSRGELLVLGRTRETKSGQLSILARGAGQQILGTEASVVILDDATDEKISGSPAEREKHMKWIRGSVLSRVMTKKFTNASGRAIIVGQRIHLHDMYGDFEKMEGLRGERKGKKLWHVVKYKAILRWPDEDPENPEPLVLWPEFWTYDELMESYDRLGHSEFEKMYQQNPLPEDDMPFKPQWWDGCRDYDRPGFKGVRQRGSEQFLPVARIVSIDPSPTQFNAMIVADVTSARDLFVCTVLEVKSWKGGAKEMVDEMQTAIDRYRPEYMVLESSTMTKWFEKEPVFDNLKRQVHFIQHRTGINKGDPELGVLSLAADVEAGRIRLPYADKAGRDMSTLLEEEATVYPYGDVDDILMALWFIKWNYKKIRPRGHLPTRIGKGDSGWGYIREAKQLQSSEEERMRQWRREHAS